MVCESHSGAWAPNARRILDKVAKGIAANNGERCEVASLRLAQRISVTLHRANARAILKRVALMDTDAANPEAVDSPWEEDWL